MGSKLTGEDVGVLRSAATRNTFLPWRGAFGRARQLCRDGYLIEAGGSVMPPYVLYRITDLGRAALTEPTK